MKRELCALKTSAGEVSYWLGRSPRRRTMEIRIKDSLEVNVSAPTHVSDKEIKAFVALKVSWILTRLKEQRQSQHVLKKRKYENGEEFLFLGRRFPLKTVATDKKQAGIDFDGRRWTVHIPQARVEQRPEVVVKKKLVEWYRLQAQEVLGGRIFHYARHMGLEPKKIVVRTQKRIWGSCHHGRQTINLNWLLILAPLDVIDYVVVHELCHFIYADHSRRFWKKVGQVMPDFRERQNWLRRHTFDMALP